MFVVIPDMHRVVKTVSRLTRASTFLAEVEQDNNTLPSGFGFPTVNKCSFHGLLSAMFFSFLCFSLVISLFKMVPKRSAAVPSGALKCAKAAVRLMGKIHGLRKLYLDMSYCVVGCLNSTLMNQQYILIKVSLNRNTYKTRLYIG